MGWDISENWLICCMIWFDVRYLIKKTDFSFVLHSLISCATFEKVSYIYIQFPPTNAFYKIAYCNSLFQCVYLQLQVVRVKVGVDLGINVQTQTILHCVYLHTSELICGGVCGWHLSRHTPLSLSAPLLSLWTGTSSSGSKHSITVPTTAPTHLTPDPRDLTVTLCRYQSYFIDH